MRFRHLNIADRFDHDDELEIEMLDRNVVWLSPGEVQDLIAGLRQLLQERPAGQL